MAAIEKKIIVGGENLLEKAEEQERLLEESAKELEARRLKEEQLRKQLAEKEVCVRVDCWCTGICQLPMVQCKPIMHKN